MGREYISSTVHPVPPFPPSSACATANPTQPRDTYVPIVRDYRDKGVGGGEREGGREGEPRDNYVLRIRRSKKRARGGEPTTERSIDRSGKIPGSGCAILCIEVEDHQCGYDARETEWDRRGTEREKEKGKRRKEEEEKER